MTDPSAGSPHVYPKPVQKSAERAIEAMVRFISGLMLECALGREDEFTMEVLGSSDIEIGVSCKPAHGTWKCSMILLHNDVMPSGAYLFPLGESARHPYTLRLNFIGQKESTYYYQIKSRRNRILKSFGIERG